MSADTKQACDAALNAHVASLCGSDAMVTGYVTCVSYITPEGFESRTEYAGIYSEGLPYHTALGLSVHLADEVVRQDSDDE